MKSSRLTRLKITAQHLFLLAILMLLAWYLATDADLRESIGSLAVSILWLVLIALFFIVIYRWSQQFQAPRIYPFTNATGESEDKDKYDALAHNFSELLLLEIQRINQLLYLPISITGRRILLEPSRLPTPIVSTPTATPRSMTSLGGKTVLSGVQSPLPKLPYAGTSPYLFAKANVDQEISETLQGVGALSLGPVSLPLGGLISLIMRSLQGGGITGSVQKYGDSLTVIATYESKKWEVSERVNTALQNDVDQTAIRKLAHHLAVKMIAEVGEHTSTNWQSSKELIDGLEHYQRYLRSGSLNQHALLEAQRHFEKAIMLDDRFGMAYYYLGLVYDERRKAESALRMYKEAIVLDPELHEAHFRIGETHAQANRFMDAIESGERAVAIAQKSNIPAPIVRSSLGRWLATVAQIQTGLGDFNAALKMCKTSIEHLRIADHDYERLADQVQHVTEYSSIYEANLREARIGVLQDLSWAYKSLGDIWALRADDKGIAESPNRYMDRTAGRIWRYFHKWMAKLRTRNIDRIAERTLQHCLELDANSAETHILLAEWYLGNLRFEPAIYHLEQARKIKPEDTALHLDLGGFYLEPAMETVTEVVGEYLQDPARWRDERGDQDIHAIYQHFQAAVLYYDNVLNLIRQRDEFGERVSGDTLAALHGLASAHGGLALYKYLYDLAFEHEPDFSNYQEDISNALALLGKALALDPFSLSLYDDLDGAYRVEDYLLVRWQEYEQRENETSQTDPDPDPASLVEDLTLLEGETPILRAYETIYERISLIDGFDLERERQNVMIDLLTYALSTPEQRQKGELAELPFEQEQLVSLLEWVDEDPETQRYLWVTGWMMTYWHDWVETGVQLIEKALQMGPMIEAELATFDLGEVYLFNQQYDKAIECYWQVGSGDPYYWQSRKTMVELLNQLELDPSQEPIDVPLDVLGEPLNLEKAYEMAIEAAEGDPYRLAWAYAERADLYHRREKYDQAIRDCNQAINLIPGYTYPYVLLALISMNLFDYDEAIENWERVQELTPYQDLSLYHLGLGDAYYNKALDSSSDEDKTTCLRRAVAAYRRAINLFDPEELADEVATYNMLGQALTELGEFAEASLAFQSSLALIQESPEAYLIHTNLAFVYVKQKRFGLARSEYLKAIQLCEEHSNMAELAEAANLLAYYIHAERGINLEEGLTWVNRALDLLPQTDYSEEKRNDLEGAYLDTRGWIFFKQGQYDLARADVEKALSLTMGTVYEHAHLAVIYWYMGESSKDEAERKGWRKKAFEQAVLAEDMDRKGVWEEVLQLYPELAEIRSVT